MSAAPPVAVATDDPAAVHLRQQLAGALLALAPLLLAADSSGRGHDLAMLIALVLGSSLVLQQVSPAAARTHPAALALIAATAVAVAGWLLAALLPAAWPPLAALAPLVAANAAWWQGASAQPQSRSRQLVTLAVLCLAPVLVGLTRQIAVLCAMLIGAIGSDALAQPLTQQPALLFIGAACLLALLQSVHHAPPAAARPGPESA